LSLKKLLEFGTENLGGWMVHSGAIDTVLQLSGPDAFTDNLKFEIFQYYRAIGVRILLETK
jgi:hypothetical protein